MVGPTMLMRGAGCISQGTSDQDAMNVAAYFLNEVDEGGLMDFSNGTTSRRPLPLGTSGTESGM